jgi:hypothetical protein
VSYQVVKKSKALLETYPTAAAFEGLLYIMNLLLPDTGVE